MAKQAVLILLSAFCLLSLVGAAVAVESHFFVEGQVYCDTCRAQFVTRLSRNIPVDGDHEDDICQIIPVKSSDPECAQINNGLFAKEAARISLTSNNGIITPTRTANPLGFMRKNALPECGEVFKELGLLPEDLNDQSMLLWNGIDQPLTASATSSQFLQSGFTRLSSKERRP